MFLVIFETGSFFCSKCYEGACKGLSFEIDGTLNEKELNYIYYY